MKKEWFSSKELAEISGLPSTTQGINRKARTEKWRSRKRMGVQGKAVEYHIDSLPDFVRTHLKIWEEPAGYDIVSVTPTQLWMTAYQQLTDIEKSLLSTWLLRNGVRGLLAFIQESEDTQD